MGLSNAVAQQIEDSPEQSKGEYLFGDLGGLRTTLEEHGVDLQLFAIHDFAANVSGGIERNAGIIGNIGISLAVDTTKAGLWEDGKFFYYGLGIYGSEPSKWVGDFQYTENIQGVDEFQIYQMWYAHSFADDKLNLLFGIHDFNTEFSVLQYALPLINSSFWVAPTLTQHMISTYPTTGLGARMKVKPTEQTYLLYGAYDGNTSEPGRPFKQNLDWRKNDGLFQIAEIGYENPGEEDRYFKFAIGSYVNSAQQVTVKGNPASSDWGAYLLSEIELYSEEDTEQGLGGFFQYAVADPSVNQVTKYLGVGLSYKGLIPGRDNDLTLFGYNMAKNGSEFRAANPGLYERSERVVELAYRMEVTPYFALTPDIQFVQDPSMIPGVSDAVFMMLRTELAL